jgi:hypothetical protein
MKRLGDIEHRGKVELTCKTKEGKVNELKLLIDGQEIPHLEIVDVYVSSGKQPTVMMKFIPEVIQIRIDDGEILIRRKSELGL